jgi:hypothetical protein
MRLTIAAATVAIASLLAAAPASAEHIMGGGVKHNGQCWKAAKTMDGGTFGSWNACAASASAPVASRHQHHS